MSKFMRRRPYYIAFTFSAAVPVAPRGKYLLVAWSPGRVLSYRMIIIRPVGVAVPSTRLQEAVKLSLNRHL